MFDFVDPLVGFVDAYGLLAICLLVFLDSAMLLPGFPGELLLIWAAVRYSSDHAGLIVVIAAVTVAATLGSLLLYGIARAGQGRIIKMSPKKREKWERLFQRPSGKALVLFLRIIPFTRILINIPAGMARMRVLPFLILTFIGTAIFMAAFMFVAFQSQQEGSVIATQTAMVRDSYANPAWAYVQANALPVTLGVLALGIVLYARAAYKARNNPEEGYDGSLLGTASTAALFWGGTGLLVGLWIDAPMVFETLLRAGIDLSPIDVGLPYQPLSLLVIVGSLAVLLSLVLRSMRKEAKRRVKRAELAQKRKGTAPRPTRDPRAPPMVQPPNRAP